MRKRVYVIYNGGTIGMKRTSTGYSPSPGALQRHIDSMPELRDSRMPEVVIREYDPLIDSSNMSPDDWSKIGADIAANYSDFDGFIILHGTDTMAYTASALPFMLEGIAKPVIVTGSQIPLTEVRSDGHDNLINSLLIASTYNIPEVCLYFGDKLLRGCRSVKISAHGFAPFDSPNFPPLATFGVTIDVRWDLVRAAPKPKELRIQPFKPTVISVLRLFPGISNDFVRNALLPPVQGVILQAYGVGNGPGANRQFLNILEEATSRGVVIVDCTQCLVGSVNLKEYRAGSALATAGVISGYDMTVESTVAKLSYLFSRGGSSGQVRRDMQRNLRGELTVPPVGQRKARRDA